MILLQGIFFAEKKAGKTAAGYAALMVLLCLAPLFMESYHLHLAILVLIYILLTSSLRTIYISGQLSLGHAAFMGVGAYTSAILSIRLDWTPWGTILIGGLAAMAVALFLSIL